MGDPQTRGRIMQLPKLPHEPLTVSIEGGSQQTGLPKATLRRDCVSGELETVVVGKRRLIVYESLKRYVFKGGIQRGIDPDLAREMAARRLIGWTRYRGGSL